MVEYRAACLTGELPPPTIVEEISSAPSSETYRLISTPQTSILSHAAVEEVYHGARESGMESAGENQPHPLSPQIAVESGPQIVGNIQ